MDKEMDTNHKKAMPNDVCFSFSLVQFALAWTKAFHLNLLTAVCVELICFLIEISNFRVWSGRFHSQCNVEL